MSVSPAFATPLALSKSALTPSQAPCSTQLTPLPVAAPVASNTSRMSIVEKTADKFMNISQTREAKAAATPYGVYTVQCTEGSAGANTAEATRVAALAANYRLRQSSAAAKTADLFATRRAAIVNAHGSHVDESYAVRFPARAAASVLGRAEKLRACSRYFPADETLMFECVDRQYKALKVPGGVYTNACADGRVAGDADTARVAALATQFRAAQMPAGMKEQMRYDAAREATALARGCTYEENEFYAFPKMAAAMRYSTGSYATSVTETTFLTGIKKTDVNELVKSDNLEAVWPGFPIREATPAPKRSSWYESPLKDYSPMSQAAMEFGLKSISNPFKESEYDGWTPGWQPKSVLAAGSRD